MWQSKPKHPDHVILSAEEQSKLIMTTVEPEDQLELTAHITDEEAVRRVFDANNVAWTAVQASIFSVAGVFTLLYSIYAYSRAPRLAWAVALSMTLVSVVAAKAAMDRRKRAARSETAAGGGRRSTDWIPGYYVAVLAALSYIGGHEGAGAWGVIFPFILIGLRFTLPRRLAFNGAMYAVTMTLMYLRDPRFHLNVAFSYALVFVIATSLAALNSRRVRRKTIEEWSVRRASAREQLRMRDELRYARELQLSMLPEGAPVLDWADIAGISIPATEVGGDYFDYIDADGSLAVICGDVAGHGMAAGITLSALRGGITLLRHECTQPAAVLERLQEVVTESSRRRTLVTLAAVLFDPRRRVARIANAGHPPILLRRASGRVESIELFGRPLGVRRSEPIPEREVYFDAGDIFLLHSDGIYETTNSVGEPFGLERLSSLLASLDGSAAVVRDGVLRSVAEFRGDAPQQDEVTVVVVRISSPTWSPSNNTSSPSNNTSS